MDLENVLAIDLVVINVVGAALFKNVRHRRSPLYLGPHAVLVVFDQEYDRQVPHGGQVDRFVEIADVGRAFAQDAQHGPLFFLVAQGQSHAGGQREMPADDGVPTPVVVLGAGQVHRAALAAADPGGLAQQLGHDALCVQAAGDGPSVVAIGGQEMVLCRHGLAGAHGDGLLADV
jgi:hypothetical protein